MKQDNSDFKSELRSQLEKTNEILKKTEESLEEVYHKLKKEEQRNEDKRVIVNAFLHELFCVEKPNVLSCKHDFSVHVVPYLTQKEIKEYNELLNLKEGATEEIKDILTKKMKEYVNAILDELNKMTELKFVLENRAEVTFKMENIEKRCLVTNSIKFNFIVNIR